MLIFYYRCKLWKEALGFLNNHKYANFSLENCNSTIRVCSLHFTEDSFRDIKLGSRKLLNNNAIPIMFNPSIGIPDKKCKFMKKYVGI